ncbi:L-serine dehydratase [Tindallia magadiensis]|uniref:L-serine deaminase n=1 Tax=Tindallia magadiensis TaxID=69895 RepID=A0A1I3E4Z0_9FIRM|nr:L-serine ammonia-lyase, iron-sulfur-dependent subunit beta [Tindallia magadiensis]SFH93751.1 L-serine dehydratase [Tindallia magadiensis]
MKRISAFQVMGPVMIGPSSSHTAGALRIAQIAARILKETPKEVDFYLYGSFAETYQGHGTDRALLAGMLGYATDHPDIRDAYRIADEKQLIFRFFPTELQEGMHPNTVAIKVVGISGNNLSLTGASVGGGEVVITNINGISVAFTGEYPTLIVQQQDRPGVAAHITSVLAGAGVNIGTIKMYREYRGDRAFTILETDDQLDKELVQQIHENQHIYDVFMID